MIALLTKLAPDEGYNLTALPGVRLLRSNRALERTPVLYDPGIVIVCQGRKRGYWGDATYLYDARHYLAVAVPVPFTMETDASAEEPLLAIYFHLDFKLAADLMLQLNDEPTAEPKGMYASPMEPRLNQSVLRLLEALDSPLDARILGPSLLREIYYRILTGAQGGSMCAALTARGRFGRVSQALRKIHGSLGERLDVEQLAAEANMSVPTFHAHFKAITHTSPMQYLKSTRLHQARLLMARNGYSVAMAASEVGYESGSQFSREFKRLFSRTPTDEVARMKGAFALPPPMEDSVFVSSH
ncbi:AraC family transcriptional regulator [Pseudomonas sp. TH03]|uniref:AraC family transcriptional regulator n=1 Tax=Pseudomonas sp. TH03 TaxID=2796369 RepID=UPI0019131C21|nr:AraC family transcriptional regulator [Pseudomonas sp. TH03]MBK5554125.1 AraC family transcriptional regulator [Pseudomonas sp. TH03]